MRARLRRIAQGEGVSPRTLWLMAGEGTGLWYAWIARALAPQVGGPAAARELVARAAAPAFLRRYDQLAQAHGWTPRSSGGAPVGATLRAFYPGPMGRLNAGWVMAPLAGAGRPRVRALTPQARWEEVTVHLGEVLVALTEGLPRLGVRRANHTLGAACLQAGRLYGRALRPALGLPSSVAGALELLRTTEVLFRVNVQHTLSADEVTRTGLLAGDACPWYDRPGWAQVHCGIFGQFQRGICEGFGLRYHLTKTIPRHGGGECHIEVRPLQIQEPRQRG
jgi:hypothetical protein